MTASVKITASTPGYGALMTTLIGAQPLHVGTFNARVRATIQQQNAAERTRRERSGR